MHILLVEDEESLAQVIQLNLEIEGYTVTLCKNGEKALELVDRIDTYELVILDVMLPNASGWDICEKIRTKSKLPILFISAKGNSEDRIKGLKLGADDYLPKPFDLEELLLRVSILLKRFEKQEDTHTDQLTINGVTIDFLSYELTNNGQSLVKLSKREVELLKLFQTHQNEVVSRDLILDELWGKDQFPSPRTIDNYILAFRKIFENNPKEPHHFLSIRGVGYKFVL
ncbi:MAG: response regulator transcription factor [Lishizhenia sp.]